MRTNHAWRKKDSHIKVIIKENTFRKRPLSKLRLQWKDRVQKYVEAVETYIEDKLQKIEKYGDTFY